MNNQQSQASYDLLLKCLHWGMFLLLVAVFASIELRVLYEKGTDARNAFKYWHFVMGLSVLALVALRSVVRLKQTYPVVSPPLPSWQKRLSVGVHLLLYAVMIVMPVTGWLTLSAEGKDIPFGLPPLTAINESLAHDVEELHELIGKTAYFLIGLHIVSALYHQLVRKDNVLQRMWR